MLDKDIEYLCDRLKIKDDPICISNEKIYPADFSALISEWFETPSTTYQDFQNVFAQYQTKLTVYKEPDVIVGLYDINRDGEWDFMPYFDGTFEDNLKRFLVFRESFD